MKRKLFRWAVDAADRINIFIQDKLNLNPKRKVLELQQDMTSVEELERTIGKSLGMKGESTNTVG